VHACRGFGSSLGATACCAVVRGLPVKSEQGLGFWIQCWLISKQHAALMAIVGFRQRVPRRTPATSPLCDHQMRDEGEFGEHSMCASHRKAEAGRDGPHGQRERRILRDATAPARSRCPTACTSTFSAGPVSAATS